MDEDHKLFFELGLMYSRLRRLCYEQGVVKAESGVEDYLKAFIELISKAPVSEEVKNAISRDVTKIEEMLEKYTDGERLSESDSRTILAMINRWRDQLFKSERVEGKDIETDLEKKLEEIENMLGEIKTRLERIEKESKVEEVKGETLSDREFAYKLGKIQSALILKEKIGRKLYEFIAKFEKEKLDEIGEEVMGLREENLEVYKSKLEEVAKKIALVDDQIENVKKVMEEVEAVIEEEIVKTPEDE